MADRPGLMWPSAICCGQGKARLLLHHKHTERWGPRVELQPLERGQALPSTAALESPPSEVKATPPEQHKV